MEKNNHEWHLRNIAVVHVFPLNLQALHLNKIVYILRVKKNLVNANDVAPIG